jgi:hypothetical protein
MKANLAQTIIIAVAIVASAYLLSNGIASLGRGIEAAATSRREVSLNFPNSITLNTDLKVSSPGNGGLLISGIK